MDFSVLIGMIIKCEQPKKFGRVNTLRRCSDLDCKNFAKTKLKGKFCPKCGSKIENFSHTYHESMKFCNIIQESELDIDEFTLLDPEGNDNDIHLLIANMPSRKYSWSFSDDCGYDFKVLDPETIEHLKTEFNEEYASELMKLEEYYKRVSTEFAVKTEHR